MGTVQFKQAAGGRDSRRCVGVAPVDGTGSITGLPDAAAGPLPVDGGHLPHHRHLFRLLFLGLEARGWDPVPRSWLGSTKQPSVEHYPGFCGVGHLRGVPGLTSGRCGPGSRFPSWWLGDGDLERARYPLGLILVINPLIGVGALTFILAIFMLIG